MKVWSTGKFLKEDFGDLNENKKLKIRKLYSMIVPIIFKYSIFYDPSKISFISKSKFIKFENSSDKFELKLSREMVGWINDKFFQIMYIMILCNIISTVIIMRGNMKTRPAKMQRTLFWYLNSWWRIFISVFFVHFYNFL